MVLVFLTFHGSIQPLWLKERRNTYVMLGVMMLPKDGRCSEKKDHCETRKTLGRNDPRFALLVDEQKRLKN